MQFNDEGVHSHTAGGWDFLRDSPGAAALQPQVLNSAVSPHTRTGTRPQLLEKEKVKVKKERLNGKDECVCLPGVVITETFQNLPQAFLKQNFQHTRCHRSTKKADPVGV